MLNTTVSLPNGVTIQLFDAANSLIATIPLAVAPQVGFSIFSEGLFTYFRRAGQAGRTQFHHFGPAFVLDNLAFQTGAADEDSTRSTWRPASTCN